MVNIDETSWRENRQKAWLWATVTGLCTVFTIAKSRSGEIAAALLGSKDDQVVGSDRFSAYEWIKASWRQVCWAHLRRDFQAMIDRGGDGETIGRAAAFVVEPVVPRLAQRRDGTLPWSAYQKRMRSFQRKVKQTLQEGSRCPCAKTAATCFELLKVEEGLWSFACVEGIARSE